MWSRSGSPGPWGTPRCSPWPPTAWACPIWRETDAALIDLAEREIRKVGLVADEAISAGHVIRVPRSYPVYARGYGETLAPVVTFLRSYDNLWPIGRYGSFKYNNQDHSMLMGLLAAENIALHRDHDLWSVNTDYEAYQERSLIAETGLVEQAT